MDEIKALIAKEYKRQAETLTLIPSENYTSAEVRNAEASFLMHKYAEGYPGKRYYQGSEIADQVENLAIERAKKLFHTPSANVQPYSGSIANLAVYLALAQPGETVMGMDLKAGGHLTHGAATNFSGKLYKPIAYSTDKNGLIDFEEVRKLAEKHRPKIIWAGGTAYPRIFDWKKFSAIAESVGAWFVADISHYAGLVAGEAYPTPADFAHVITTTTHKTLRGPRGAIIMVSEKGLKKDPGLSKKIDCQVFPGLQGGPHLNTIAAIAIALREAQGELFQEYARLVIKNCQVFAEELKKYGFDLVTGGTDCHLALVDLREKGINGKEAADALEKAGIIVNANAIPNDEAPPYRPSGIRLGTPAITTRGMKEKEMLLIAGYINEVFKSLEDEKKLAEIRNSVNRLCQKFPLP